MWGNITVAYVQQRITLGDRFGIDIAVAKNRIAHEISEKHNHE